MNASMVVKEQNYAPIITCNCRISMELYSMSTE